MILIKNAPKVKEIPLDYPSDYRFKSAMDTDDHPPTLTQLMLSRSYKEVRRAKRST